MRTGTPNLRSALLAFTISTTLLLSNAGGTPPVFYEASELPDPTVQDNSAYGFAVAIDNGIALVGDPRGSSPDGYVTGVVEVFDVSDPTSPIHLAEFTDENAAEPHPFPFQMDFDWPLAAIGTLGGGPYYADDRRAGAVFIFDLTDPEHPQQRSVAVPSNDLLEDIGFGSDVAIGGGVVAVTGYGDYVTYPFGDLLYGIVYLYKASTGELLAIIDPGPDVGYAGFFGDLAIEDDLLFVGAPDGGSYGRIHIYDITDPRSPVWLSTIEGGLHGARSLGYAIDVDDGFLVAGDPNWQISLDNRVIGRVFAFDINDPGDPTLIATFSQDQPRDLDRFGWGVAIDDGIVVACCADEPLLGADGPTAETAYIFKLLADESEPSVARIRSAAGAPELSGFSITPLRLSNGVAISKAGYDAAVTFSTTLPCGPADLTTPRGTLDLADLIEFVTRFTAGDPIADFDGSGVYDLDDVVAFVTAFAAGCSG